MKVIHSKYKQRNMKIWNEVAPRYHKRWASVNKGPFQSTKKLIELVKINKNNLVLRCCMWNWSSNKTNPKESW